MFSKLFDSIARLDLIDNKRTRDVIFKEATAMYSKESEKVDFRDPCDLSGQVEVWLNRLLDKMRETVRYWLAEAINAYEDKPRELWVQDYPAQIGIGKQRKRIELCEFNFCSFNWFSSLLDYGSQFCLRTYRRRL